MDLDSALPRLVSVALVLFLLIFAFYAHRLHTGRETTHQVLQAAAHLRDFATGHHRVPGNLQEAGIDNSDLRYEILDPHRGQVTLTPIGSSSILLVLPVDRAQPIGPGR